MCSLTATLPFSNFSPIFSKPIPSKFNLRPIDTNIFSAWSFSPDSNSAVTPSSLLLTLVIFAFVTILIPFRFKKSCIWRITCTSSVDKIVGNNSTIANSQPKALKIEANSHPITPPPTTIRLLGNSVNSNAPVLVNTCSSSISKIGIFAGSEPVAMMIFRASTSSTVPSVFVTSILPGCMILPLPLIDLILLPLNNVPTPLTSFRTTSSFWDITLAKSIFASLTSIPNSAAFLTIEANFAEEYNVFVGMQPRFRHVPPNSPFSITQTLPPNCAALIAAT